MARMLRTYVTSAGFFDLAIAAPSQKAALEAWGSRANLFHHGFARRTHDAAVVAATMARPGVALRRPVGSKVAYREDAEPPRDLPATKPKARPKTKAKAKTKPPSRIEENESREDVVSFEHERQRRERARLKAEEAQERAIARAEATLDKARTRHERKIEEIDRRLRAEDARWAKQRAGLEAALRKARRFATAIRSAC